MRAELSNVPVLTGELAVERPPPLGKLLKIQSRVIGALMMREIYTRFGRDNIGFAWIVAEPMLFSVAVIILWSFSKHSQHTEIPLVPFILTGYMSLLLYRHMIGRMMRCMQANASLLYHRHITVLALYLARIGVEVLGTSTAFAFCMLAFMVSGHVQVPQEPSLMLCGWLLHIWYCSSSAVAIGALSERSELIEKIWTPISYIMIPLSGAFYMLYWLPPAAIDFLVWMPPVNVTEMLRGGYFGPGIPVYYDIAYLVYFNATLTLIGLYFSRNARRYIEVE